MHFRSLVDVLALCNYCILANVLDYNTYQFLTSKGEKATPHHLHLRSRYNYNALSPVKRRYFVYIQGLAINFLKWLNSQYEIKLTLDPDPGNTLGELVLQFLSDQGYTILNYKRKAEKQGIRGISNCKAADVQRQLQLLFVDNANLPGTFSSLDC